MNKILDDFNLDNDKLEKIEKFYKLVLKYNKMFNLTTILEEKDFYIKHILDSIIIIKYIDIKANDRIIDIGTGGGFPGIPLSIILTNTKFTLVDSKKKKIEFLKVVKDELNLHNVTLSSKRAETIARDKEHREKYDYSLSRAVANLQVLLEYSIPFLKVGGNFIAYKSIKANEELENSQNAIEKLSCCIKNIYDYDIIDNKRKLIVFQKKLKTSNKYPRHLGIPKINPL